MMLSTKETKDLHAPSKIYLLPMLLLLGYNSLQAAHFNNHTAQEDPIIQSIWENQIDPALGWSSMLFSPLAGFHGGQQNAASPWPLSTFPYMRSDTPFMYNGMTPHLSMTPHCSLINMGNPLASPCYYFTESTLEDNNSLAKANHASLSMPSTSTPFSPPNIPTSPWQKTIRKEKQATIAEPKTVADKSHICAYCGKKLKNKSILKAHIRIHTNNKPYQCTYCSKRFAQKSNLTTHIRIHTNNKPFPCIYCSKRFSQHSNLKKHLRIHTHDKPFKCSYCSKKFAQKSTLTTHLRTHTLEKPFHCTYCSKSFAHNSNLINHFRTHTQEKPYSCTHCHKRFTERGNLKRHLRTHTHEKPFQCKYCSKAFAQKSNLKRHIKSQHN